MKAPARPAAEVISEKCTGCLNCYKDCPYEAMTIRPANGGKSAKLKAAVLPGRCASCSLCVGACEYGAIAGGGLSMLEIENKMIEYSKKLINERTPVLVFTCQLWPGLKSEVSSEGQLKTIRGTWIIPVPCIGAIPPEIAYRAISLGFSGLLLASCISDDCFYRLGHLWTSRRLSRERLPYYKEDIKKIILKEYVPVEKRRFLKDLADFKKSLE